MSLIAVISVILATMMYSHIIWEHDKEHERLRRRGNDYIYVLK